MPSTSHGVNRVVVVGAGLDGLSCGLHLAGAGRGVTIVEPTTAPGGELGRLELGGYRLDPGPTSLTAPDVLAEAFAAVGEQLADWVELVRLEPAYRVFFPDGATLDVSTDPERMEQSVADLCGPKSPPPTAITPAAAGERESGARSGRARAALWCMWERACSTARSFITTRI